MNSIGKIMNGRYQEFANTKKIQETNTEEILEKISKNKTDIENAKQEISTVHADITQINSVLEAQGTTINNLDAKMTEHSSSINALESEVVNTKEKVSVNETNISNLQTSVSNAENLITSQGERLSTAEENITSTKREMSDVEETLSTHASDITSSKSTIAQHCAKITEAENDISEIKTKNESQDTMLANKLDKTGDASNTTVSFTQATTLANVSTGEKLGTLFGKVAKLYHALTSGVLSKFNLAVNSTPKRVVITNTEGKFYLSGVTTDELSHLSGVTDDVQTQINNNKQEISNNKKEIEVLNEKTDEMVGKCFRIDDFGQNGELFTKENFKILLHNRIRVLAKKIAGDNEVQVAYCGLWPGVTWIVGQLTLMGSRSPETYMVTAYTSSGSYIGYGDYTISTMAVFVQLNEVPNTTNAPWLKTWSVSEWKSAGGNLPEGVEYGHVIRVFGSGEPGIGNKTDTSFQLIAYVDASKSKLYTAYQSTRGSTTIPWTLSGGGGGN